MKILVSNDDGIYSPGLAALAEVALEFGDVRVVAPSVEQSSASHAITASRPLSYRRVTIKNLTAYAVNGTPADCVALGAHHWEKVDWVLSGCNLGLNLGAAIWHSGTVAAAKQATLLGIRAIAFSGPPGDNPDFDDLKPWMKEVLRQTLHEDGPKLLNVNLPRAPRGLMWTRAAVRLYDGQIVPTTHPSGRELYWFTVKPLEAADEGTDRWAVEQGWVSLTPLRLDLTDEPCLAEVRERHPLDEAVASALAPAQPSEVAAKQVREDEAPTASLEQTVSETATEATAPARDANADNARAPG